jgi:predicted dehydrogenase
LSYLADSPVETVSASMVDDEVVCSDKMSIILKFTDGSIGTINYFANGAKIYPKERLEIFSDGRVLTVENFRITKGYGFGNFKKFRTSRQDKGHKHEIAAFVNLLINGGKILIPFEQLVNVTKASFAVMDSAAKGKTINLQQQEQPLGSEWPLSNLFYNSHQQFAICEESKSQDKFENV